jgi:sec-independent protein translocase protein TatA
VKRLNGLVDNHRLTVLQWIQNSYEHITLYAQGVKEMPHFSPIGLVIVLLIVLVLFGGGRVGKLGGELGTAIREFRRGLEGPDENKKGGETPDEASKKE